jgi:hypothetical protein
MTSNVSEQSAGITYLLAESPKPAGRMPVLSKADVHNAMAIGGRLISTDLSTKLLLWPRVGRLRKAISLYRSTLTEERVPQSA